MCLCVCVDSMKHCGSGKSKLEMDLMSGLSINHDINNPLTAYSVLNSRFTLLRVISWRGGGGGVLEISIIQVPHHDQQTSITDVFNSSTSFHNLLSCKVINGPNFLYTN